MERAGRRIREAARAAGAEDFIDALPSGFDTVLGERVNLASRLCSAAPPGEVWVDGAMAAAIGGNRTVERREPIRLRGFSDPVSVFSLEA